MQVSITKYPIRLVALMLVPILGCVGLTGLLWNGTNLPETSRNWFGSVLAADLARATLYGLARLIPASLAMLRLRDEKSQLWRGIALVFAVCGGHALLAGNVLTLDRAMAWPVFPMRPSRSSRCCMLVPSF